MIRNPQVGEIVWTTAQTIESENYPQDIQKPRYPHQVKITKVYENRYEGGYTYTSVVASCFDREMGEPDSDTHATCHTSLGRLFQTEHKAIKEYLGEMGSYLGELEETVKVAHEEIASARERWKELGKSED